MPGPTTYYNHVNGEYTRILTSAEDTGGEYSLLEVCLKPGGGNPLHYHKQFTEEFISVKGRLGLQYKEQILHLSPDEKELVPARVAHRFFNDSHEEIIFHVILRPGQPGFENFLKVMFGLVNDGRTITKNQIPTNILHIAILYRWGDTHLTNIFFRIFSPLVSVFYRFADKRGTAQHLLKKYGG